MRRCPGGQAGGYQTQKFEQTRKKVCESKAKEEKGGVWRMAFSDSPC